MSEPIDPRWITCQIGSASFAARYASILAASLLLAEGDVSVAAVLASDMQRRGDEIISSVQGNRHNKDRIPWIAGRRILASTLEMVAAELRKVDP